VQNLAGIGGVGSFGNMHDFRFRPFGLKMPFSRHQNWRFGGFDPLNGETYQRNPQKAQAERRHGVY